MRSVVQRVTSARVLVDDVTIGSIDRGLLALVGISHEDDPIRARRLARKLWELRIFDDDAGVMNRSVAEVGGAVLVVSQFTLYGDTSRGRRPSWIKAARPDEAGPLVEEVVAELGRLGAPVASGSFGATMRVELVNDGPVTVIVET